MKNVYPSSYYYCKLLESKYINNIIAYIINLIILRTNVYC